jgi:hypothetical protein
LTKRRWGGGKVVLHVINIFLNLAVQLGYPDEEDKAMHIFPGKCTALVSAGRKHKIIMTPFFCYQNGNCHKGPECTFLHAEEPDFGGGRGGRRPQTSSDYQSHPGRGGSRAANTQGYDGDRMHQGICNFFQKVCTHQRKSLCLERVDATEHLLMCALMAERPLQFRE